MEVDHYLVLIKSNICGACNMFNPVWNASQADMKKLYPNLNIITLSSPNFSFDYDREKYPSGIEQYVKHFPMIFIFTKKQWSYALDTKTNITQPITVDFNAKTDKDTFLKRITETIKSVKVVNQPKITKPKEVQCKTYLNIVPFSLK